VAPVREVSGGGAFLIRSLNPEQLFTREDLSDEQRLFGQTAAEFMRQEVLPNEASLYAHDWVKTRELLKKAADLDLLRLEIPAEYGGLGLDKISAAYVGEEIAVNPSFAGSLGTHTSIGTLPIVYFGTPAQKALLGKLSPDQVTSTELAGESIQQILSHAPGNDQAIGGLKVCTESGWFAARPSGTEDVYKIYAESFKGAEHLSRIQEEARAVVADALGSG